MLIDVLDTETCGFDGGVVELARLTLDLEKMQIVDYAHCLVKPDRPIGVEALAVHHITEDMVKDCDPIEVAINLVQGEHVAAHNAPFDQKMLSPHLDDRAWIDTLKLARKYWPEAPSHKNQVLRYWRNLNFTMPEEAGNMAHRALYDTFVTAHILMDLVKTFDLVPASLAQASSVPLLLERVSFGKHRGQLWSEVPRNYLEYLDRGQHSDPDVRHTVRHYLGRR